MQGLKFSITSGGRSPRSRDSQLSEPHCALSSGSVGLCGVQRWNYQCYSLVNLKYVTSSVALPALWKTVFTTYLKKERDSSNLKWLKISTALDPRSKNLKCIPRDDREDMRALLKNILNKERIAQQPSPQGTKRQNPTLIANTVPVITCIRRPLRAVVLTLRPYCPKKESCCYGLLLT